MLRLLRLLLLLLFLHNIGVEAIGDNACGRDEKCFLRVVEQFRALYCPNKRSLLSDSENESFEFLCGQSTAVRMNDTCRLSYKGRLTILATGWAYFTIPATAEFMWHLYDSLDALEVACKSSHCSPDGCEASWCTFICQLRVHILNRVMNHSIRMLASFDLL